MFVPPGLKSRRRPSLPSRLGSLGERRKLPSGVRGRSPFRGQLPVLVNLELETTHLMATSVMFLTLLQHIFTHIDIITKHHAYICFCYTVKTVVNFFHSPLGGEGLGFRWRRL